MIEKKSYDQEQEHNPQEHLVNQSLNSWFELNTLRAADFSAHHLKPRRNFRKIAKIYLSNL